jgi:hypothetical protein
VARVWIAETDRLDDSHAALFRFAWGDMSVDDRGLAHGLNLRQVGFERIEAELRDGRPP